jgi:hypothetical protein
METQTIGERLEIIGWYNCGKALLSLIYFACGKAIARVDEATRLVSLTDDG